VGGPRAGEHAMGEEQDAETEPERGISLNLALTGVDIEADSWAPLEAPRSGGRARVRRANAKAAREITDDEAIEKRAALDALSCKIGTADIARRSLAKAEASAASARATVRVPSDNQKTSRSAIAANAPAADARRPSAIAGDAFTSACRRNSVATTVIAKTTTAAAAVRVVSL
jgi:hypothetical protein